MGLKSACTDLSCLLSRASRLEAFLSIQRSANNLTASTAAVATLLYYTRRESGVVGNLFSSRVPVLSIWRACICPIFLSFFLFLSWVGLGQCVGVGAGFYTMLLPHSHLYLTKIGEASRSFWLDPGRPGRSWRFEDEDVPGVRESGSAKIEVEKRAP